MKKVYTAFLVVLFASMSVFSQNGWVQLTDYPGNGSAGVVGFSFYDQGMAGFGYYSINTNCFTDFWTYKPADSSWEQKLDLPANQRYQPCGFTIGKSSYVCLGCNAVSYFKDLWQYDEYTNTWVQKADFPGLPRYGAVAYGGVTTAYVGLGEFDNSSGITDYMTDFYEYNQITDTWTAKASFPGQPRFYGFSFTVDGKMYVVGGRSENAAYTWQYLKDMWAYDPSTDSWAQKAPYPGGGSMGLAGFALGQYAYVGLGYYGTINYDDFWRYDPASDTWLNLDDFPGGARRGSMCFSIATTGYLGCGYTNTFMKDFWKYNDPQGMQNINLPVAVVNVYPVPSANRVYVEGENICKILLFSSNGVLVKELNVAPSTLQSELDISSLIPGYYFAKIYVGSEVICKKVIKF